MKRAPRIPKAPAQHIRRERAGMDKQHLDNVRHLLCLGCGSDGSPNSAPGSGIITREIARVISGVHVHHLMRSGERGMSMKSPDKYAVPLCWFCHDPRSPTSVHHSGDEDSWFSARGIDARAVAQALWHERGNPEGMRRVIDRARQAAALKLRPPSPA